MVRKEVWAHLLAYNLIRSAMAVAAGIAGLYPFQLSFKGAVQAVNAFAGWLWSGGTDELARLCGQLRGHTGTLPDRGAAQSVGAAGTGSADRNTTPSSTSRGGPSEPVWPKGLVPKVRAIRVRNRFTITHLNPPKQVTAIDGGVTTLSYAGNGLSWTVTEPGNRVLTATLDANNNLTGITDVDQSTRHVHP